MLPLRASKRGSDEATNQNSPLKKPATKRKLTITEIPSLTINNLPGKKTKQVGETKKKVIKTSKNVRQSPKQVVQTSKKAIKNSKNVRQSPKRIVQTSKKAINSSKNVRNSSEVGESSKAKCFICKRIWESDADKMFRKEMGTKKYGWVGCDKKTCNFWAHAGCVGLQILPNKKVADHSFLCPTHRPK